MATPHHPAHRQLTTSQPFRTIPLNLTLYHGTAHAINTLEASNITTAAAGMFHQGNIQGLETQHQLVHDLRPNDLEQFETDLVNRGVIHSSNPDTPGQRVHSLPTFRHHSA